MINLHETYVAGLVLELTTPEFAEEWKHAVENLVTWHTPGELDV